VGTAGFVALPRSSLSPGGAAGLEVVAPAGRNSNRRSAAAGVVGHRKRLANTGQEAAVRGGPEAEPFVRSARFNHAAVGHQEMAGAPCRRPWVVVDSDSKIERFSVSRAVLQGSEGIGRRSRRLRWGGELGPRSPAWCRCEGRSASDGQPRNSSLQGIENKPASCSRAQSAAVVSDQDGISWSKVLFYGKETDHLRGGPYAGWRYQVR